MTTERSSVRFYSRAELHNSMKGWKDIMVPIHQQIADGFAAVEGKVCKPGCAHCCKLQVGAMPHEMVEVVDYIRFGDHFTREERSDILDRLRSAVGKSDGLDANAYRDLDMFCPFLDEEEGKCRVYSVRPISCRAFGSKDVAICKLEKPDDGVSTFKVVPGSIPKLLATSGLFHTEFLKGCLEWWQGDGIEAQILPGQAEAVAQIQGMLDARGAT